MEIFREWIRRYFSDPQLVVLAFLLVVGFLILFWFGTLLTPVLIALVLAFLLDGAVTRLERWKIPRFICVMAVFLMFMACLMFVVLGLLPLLSRQIGQLLQQLPAIIISGQKLLLHLPEKYPDFINESQIRQILVYLTRELTSFSQQLLGLSLASVRSIITLLVYVILVPLLVFFFLKDKSLMSGWVSGFLPDDRKLANRVWNEVNAQIINYIRGKIWEILIVWGVTFIVFTYLGLQFAVLLSLLVGLSVLIPYVGATLMVLPVVLIAYFQFGVGRDFFEVVVAYLIIQILDGNLLVPLLLSGVVNLHPVAIIVSVLVFGGLWGLWGLFFAIPLATLVHAVINAWGHSLKKVKRVEVTDDQTIHRPDIKS